MFVELLADLKRGRDRYVAEAVSVGDKGGRQEGGPKRSGSGLRELRKGGSRPDSDIDIFVITTADEFAVYRAAAKAVGRGPHPFEIHVATPQEYESWYRRFIDVWREV